jgi:hypothetical protein
MSTQNLDFSTDLSEREREIIFQYLFRRLAAYRNTTELYALTEAALLRSSDNGSSDSKTFEFSQALNAWGQSILENTWVTCQEPGGGGEHIVNLASFARS